MNVAKVVACLSTCSSVQVGCVITRDRRIISSGYNGVIGGTLHCTDIDFRDRKDHHDWSLKNEVHAEENAILFAARNGIRIEGGNIYCTFSPCIRCAKMIVQSGLKKVFYLNEYDMESSMNFLLKNNVDVEQVNVNID